MRHLAPILLALCLAAPAAAQDRATDRGEPVRWATDGPLVYSYGDNIGPDLRSVVELALHRWERATGADLATPYGPHCASWDVLIDVERLNPDGPPDCGSWDCDEAGHLEHVIWDFAPDHPGVITAASMVLDATLSRAEAIGPALHGWGHLFGLEDSESVCTVMSWTPSGHIFPTARDAAAVRAIVEAH